MTQYLTAYITRGDTEYEVTAKLYDHGKVEDGYDRWTGGHWVEIIDDPEFTDFVAFDEYGVELTLTLREILDSESQMVKQYWSEYNHHLVY